MPKIEGGHGGNRPNDFFELGFHIFAMKYSDLETLLRMP